MTRIRTIKVPAQLDGRVATLVKQRGTTRSEHVRQALEQMLDQPIESVVDRA